MDLPAGANLGGRYIVEAVLGRGGFATVYAARHALLGSRHAVKVLHAGADEDMRGRMLAEGRIQARLSHPNVVRVTDVVELRDGVALVMDLIEGETLTARLGRRVPTLPEALALADGLLDGVGAAHAAGLIHRDLKPDNVLIGADGTPRVTDFGLARADDPRLRGAQTRDGIGMGTPGYMPPEAYLDAARVDARSDVFALGAILYELLTGQRASPGAHPWFVHYQRASKGDFVPLDTLAPDLPPHLVEAVHAALAPDADARPASVTALAEIWRGRGAAPTAVPVGGSIRLAASPEDAGSAPVRSTTSVPVFRSNIPAERDTFVGRESDLIQLSERLASARLVTVLGTGGTGKTRLVTRFAWKHVADWPGGVYFCDLVAARTLEGIAHEVALAMDVPLGSEDPLVQLGNALLGRGRCLVVLDNFEQVTAYGEVLIGPWMARGVDVHVLVTSRERLGLAGEALLVLDALDVESAVSLFGLRAQAQVPTFVVGPANRDDVLAIVEIVDRLPLAIELAAARIRLLSPSRLRERLRERFQILVHARGGIGRQSTLRAAIDWSWDLLAPWERAALAQYSVFAGGFSLEAAEAVLDLSRWPDAAPALDAVEILMDKSLIRRQADPDGEPRFGLYAAIQEYAAEKLRTSGAFDGSGPDCEQEAWIRHGQHYGASGTEDVSNAAYRSPVAARAFALEASNFVIACRRAIARGDGPVAVNAARAAWAVLERSGPAAAAVQLAEAVLAMPSLSSADVARTMAWSGKAMINAGQVLPALPRLEAALAQASSLGARRLECTVRSDLGIALFTLGRLEDARLNLILALAQVEGPGERRAQANLRGLLGNVLAALGDHAAAMAQYDQALALAQADGDSELEAWTQLYRVGIACELGDLAAARAYAQIAYVQARAVGLRRLELRARGVLGWIHLTEGRLDEARRYMADALHGARECGERRTEAQWLHYLGCVSLAQGRVADAEAELRAAIGILRPLQDPAATGEALMALGEVLLQRDQLAESSSSLVESVSLLRQTGASFQLGLALSCRARVALRLGHLDEATRAWREAEALEAAHGTGTGSQLRTALDRLAAEMQVRIPAAAPS